MENLNDCWVNSLTRNLPENQASSLALVASSNRGTPISLPIHQERVLRGPIGEHGVIKLSRQVEPIIEHLKEDFVIGGTILDKRAFKQEMRIRYAELGVTDFNQRWAFDYWIENFDQLPSDRGEKASFSELRLGCKLAVMQIGNCISRMSYGLDWGLGNWISKQPILIQCSSDILNGDDYVQSEEGKDRKTKETVDRYDLTEDEVQALAHPDFRKRLKYSATLAGGYNVIRQATGWNLYLLLLNSPITEQIVNQEGLAKVSLVGGLSLLLATAARARVDYAVLRDNNYSPDILETTLALRQGTVDKAGELKPRSIWAVLGPTLEITWNPLLFCLSQGIDIGYPYSIPAYIYTLIIEQALMSGVNVSWSLLRNRLPKV